MNTEVKRSGYIEIGRGIVAEHKRYGSKDIEVVPVDQQPFQYGEMVSDLETIEATGTDRSGNQKNTKIQTSKTLTASWLGDGDGRVTPPDVRRGDSVLLYTYHDTQKYFWKAIDSDVGRRRLEVQTDRTSATADEETTELTDENSITVHKSGKDGLYSISLPKANGEKTSLQIQYNAKDGVMLMKDDLGNFFEINSENVITVQNGKGTRCVVDGEDIENYADGTVTTTGTNAIKMKTKAWSVESDTTNLKASSTTNINAGTSVDISAGTSVDIQSGGTISLNGGGGDLSTAVAQDFARLIKPYL